MRGVLTLACGSQSARRWFLVVPAVVAGVKDHAGATAPRWNSPFPFLLRPNRK